MMEVETIRKSVRISESKQSFSDDGRAKNGSFKGPATTNLRSSSSTQFSADDLELSSSKNSKLGQKGEEIPSFSDGETLYLPGDCVYIESQRPDVPYFICSIRDFRKSKRDTVFVNVTWFYRPCEVPASVYQLLVQDRNTENGSSDHVLEDPRVKQRELFISDAVDTYPATALRGKISIVAFADVKAKVKEYTSKEDHWFYILRYNPESRRLANTKGEIRIGPSHQALLPDCIPYDQRPLKELHDECPEKLIWSPQLGDAPLMMYLRASRSISSFSGFCEEGGSPDKALHILSEDATTFHSLDLLHKSNYDINKALHALVRKPLPEDIQLKWEDDERKRFVKGLRQFGKNFNRIRRELLPEKETSDLVHYYYIWKKTPSALASRPHKRGRRHSVLCRRTRSTKPKGAATSEFLDLSSCSEDELDSEDSDKDLRYLYCCRHCFATKSTNWHHAGKDKLLVCYDCRMYFKKYGRMRPVDKKVEPPSYIFKAAFENLEEEVLSITGRMRTRRSSTPVTNNGTHASNINTSIRNRILHEIQEARQQSLIRKTGSPSVIGLEGNESQKGIKGDQCLDNGDEFKDTEGAKSPAEVSDESDVSSETSSSCDSNECRPEEELEDSRSPSVDLSSSERLSDDNSRSSTPDVPNDPELDARIQSRFKRVNSEEEPACARCDMVYVVKRPKKQKLSVETSERSTSSCSSAKDASRSSHEKDKEKVKSYDSKRESSPVIQSSPAHITSHYEAALRNCLQQVGGDPRLHPHLPFMWPHFNSSVPRELGMHHHRPRSPGETPPDYGNKFGHLLDLFHRHGIPLGHGQGHHEPGKHGFPGFPRHPPGGHVALDDLSRRSPQPQIDPLTGLPMLWNNSHLHSHHHMHTHLHLHPNEQHRAHHGPHEQHPNPVVHQPPPINPLLVSQMDHSMVRHHPELLGHVQDPRVRSGLGLGGIGGQGGLDSGVVRDMAARDMAARDMAARDMAARDMAAGSLTARDLAARDLAARDLAARDLAVRDLAVRDLAARDMAARELSARDIPVRELAGRDLSHREAAAARELVARDLGIREENVSQAVLQDYMNLRYDPAGYHVWLSQMARLHQHQRGVSEHGPNSLHHLRMAAERDEYLQYLRSREHDSKLKVDPLLMSERSMGRGEPYPFPLSSYLDSLYRMQNQTSPGMKPVTIDLSKD